MRSSSPGSGVTELERARLAFISASGSPLATARHGVDEPEPDRPELDGTAGDAVGGDDPQRSRALALTFSLPVMRLERNHVLVILLALLGAIGIAVVSLTRSAASEVPLDVVSVQAPVSTPSPSPTPVPPMRIHVMGAVARPGVVELVEGAIVLDAIEAAGGLTSDANAGELNLAARVADGQQIIVGTADDPGGELKGEGSMTSGSAGASPAAGGLVNLNTATQAQLEALPGVGPVTAGAIVAWRDEHEKFSSVAELQEVDGIGPKSFAKLEPLVTV